LDGNRRSRSAKGTLSQLSRMLHMYGCERLFVSGAALNSSSTRCELVCTELHNEHRRRRAATAGGNGAAERASATTVPCDDDAIRRAIGSAVHRPCAASCGDRDMARLRLATRRWAWISARPIWCILAQVRSRTCPLERSRAVSPYPIRYRSRTYVIFRTCVTQCSACGVARHTKVRLRRVRSAPTARSIFTLHKSSV
jgi:hypothetical protein